MELLEYVRDYQRKFDGRICQVKTNYKPLEIFLVEFHLTDLHHLFGLHKITRDYASQTIPAIQSGDFLLKSYRKHHKYREVVERVALYDFLSSIFYQDEVEYCVVRKDLQSNTMNLDVLFFENGNRQATVLGLRKDKTGTFRPVTLHKTSAKKYVRVRKTTVKEVNWITK